MFVAAYEIIQELMGEAVGDPRARPGVVAVPQTFGDAVRSLSDLASPPGNRLEALKGEFKGFHSIRINDQWRVVFRWTEAGPVKVDIRDYH